MGFSANTLSRSNSLAVSVSSLAVGWIDQHPLFEIEHAAAHAHARPGAPPERPVDAAQHALDPRQQLARLEWLSDVVVGAGFQPDHSVDGVGGCRHHDDADAPALLAQPARERKAVLAGQADIEQHQRRQLALEQPAQRDAAVGAADAEILFAEVIDQQLTLRRLVLDHDDMRTVIHILSNTKFGTLPGSALQSVDGWSHEGARPSMRIDAL